jgi:hypothetical protein
MKRICRFARPHAPQRPPKSVYQLPRLAHTYNLVSRGTAVRQVV